MWASTQLGSSNARADTTSSTAYALSFTWSAPEGCPPQAAVITRARELGESAFTLTQPTTTGDVAVVEVVVLEDAGQFDVTFNGVANGQPFGRQLHTSSCDEAAEATALLLAMMVQTESSTNAPANSVTPVDTDTHAAPATVDADASVIVDNSQPLARPTAPLPTGPRKPVAPALPRDGGSDASTLGSSHRWAMGAAVSANRALLPNTALGVVAQLGYEFRGLRVSAEGTWLPPVDQRLRTTPAIGARLSLWSTALRAGYWQPVKLGSAAAAWGVSLAAEVGQLRGQAYGTEEATARTVLWLATSGGVGGLVKISPTWATVVLAEAVVPVTRTEFTLRNVGSTHAAAAVGARARVGLEAQF